MSRESNCIKIEVKNIEQADKIKSMLEKLEVNKNINDTKPSCLGIEKFDVKESNGSVIIMLFSTFEVREILGRILDISCGAKVKVLEEVA